MGKERCGGATTVFDAPAYGLRRPGPGAAPIREELSGAKLPASTLTTTPALAQPEDMLEVAAVAFVEDS